MRNLPDWFVPVVGFVCKVKPSNDSRFVGFVRCVYLSSRISAETDNIVVVVAVPSTELNGMGAMTLYIREMDDLAPAEWVGLTSAGDKIYQHYSVASSEVIPQEFDGPEFEYSGSFGDNSHSLLSPSTIKDDLESFGVMTPESVTCLPQGVFIDMEK